MSDSDRRRNDWDVFGPGSPKTKMTPKLRAIEMGFSLLLVGVVVLMIYGAYRFGTRHRRQAEQSPATTNTSTARQSVPQVKWPDNAEAWRACQGLVKTELKAPGTARFPAYSTASVKADWKGMYRVLSFVDSQNSFGALIRTSFVCAIRYDPNTRRWMQVDLAFDP